MTASNKFGFTARGGQEIRQMFIDFFLAREHKFVRSAPVAPQDDPTLLFTNAGMNQFKPIFLGENREGLRRAVNSQKCVRVSGKHNDLDQVGRDGTHHTLFEMLGSWSFGDYYKKEAIRWHWEFFTQELQIPKERLFASVFQDDDEAFELWRSETDIEEWRIMRFDAKENFWEMGDVGPCGPCSEIHFDRGDLSDQKDLFNDPIKGVNGENERFLELGNLVFIQFDRQSSGDLKPLTSTHVDTGCGLERLAAISQGVESNYETDLFHPVIAKVEELSKVPYQRGKEGTPHRVIADHIRALGFAIADGVTPGNEGRGYVLRRILRRASRFSQDLNQSEPFLYKIVPTLVDMMGEAFPELPQRQSYIEQVIESEEQRFMRTLKDGLARFEKCASSAKKVLSGENVFLLSDTYGFPVDLTRVLAEERGLSLDMAGFDKCMAEQRERARGARKFDDALVSEDGWTILSERKETTFVGYQLSSCRDVEVEVLRFREIGDELLLCIDPSPFYAESGGQAGDQGTLTNEEVELRVLDTFTIHDTHVHKCSLIRGLVSRDAMAKGLLASVDSENRRATMRNHSGTHLLHAALREVLGDHVQQQGSLVDAERLRFDFTHPQPVSVQELHRIEDSVNRQILANLTIDADVQQLEAAKAAGALALFGEKYGEKVRTIRMGDYSFELCGGTHADATGEIGALFVTSESSIAAGIRRIEAVTGLGALNLWRQRARTVSSLAHQLKARPEHVEERVHELADRLKVAEKQLKSAQQQQLNHDSDRMVLASQEVNGTRVVVDQLDPARFPRATHQMLLDSLAGKLHNGVAVLTFVDEDNLAILAAVGQEARSKIKAGDIVKELAKHADGRGGGRPDKAQAGSKSPHLEPKVREAAHELLQQRL